MNLLLYCQQKDLQLLKSAPEVSPTVPNSPDSPGGYSDEEFEDDFEDDEGEGSTVESMGEINRKLEASSLEGSQPTDGEALSPQQQQQREAKKLQRQGANNEISGGTLPSKKVHSSTAAVTLEDLKGNVPEAFHRSCELVFQLAFPTTPNVDGDDGIISILSTLDEQLSGLGGRESTNKTLADAVAKTLSKSLETMVSLESKVSAAIHCLQVVSNAVSIALRDAASLIDSAIDTAESDAASQRNALRRAITSNATESAFVAASMPLAITRRIGRMLDHMNRTAGEPRQSRKEKKRIVCHSLDRIVRATAMGLLRADADASGRERLGDFVSCWENAWLFRPQQGIIVDFSAYGLLLSQQPKASLLF